MLCQECPKRETCRELCKEAEAYVSQDHVGRRECLVKDKDTLTVSEWPEITTPEAILQLYFIDHKTQQEIANIVMKSQQYVSKIINKYRPIIVENIKKSVVNRR